MADDSLSFHDDETFGTQHEPALKEWVGKFACALKTEEERKAFLDLADRAYQLGKPNSFFQLLVCMLLAQQVEIEELTRNGKG